MTEEIVKIGKIQYTNPITHKLKDLNNEEIKGSFYDPELLKPNRIYSELETSFGEIKKKQALVKWKGYTDDFHSWIPLKDLKNININ